MIAIHFDAGYDTNGNRVHAYAVVRDGEREIQLVESGYGRQVLYQMCNPAELWAELEVKVSKTELRRLIKGCMK